MLGGGELKLVGANIAVAGIAVGLMHIWQYIPVALIFHFALTIAAKADPMARHIYLEYAKQGDVYVPWPWPGRQKQKNRPIGFGRGESN